MKLWRALTIGEKKSLEEIISSPSFPYSNREGIKEAYKALCQIKDTASSFKPLPSIEPKQQYYLRSYLIKAIERLLLIQYVEKHKNLKKILIQNILAERRVPDIMPSRFPISENLIKAFHEDEELFYVTASTHSPLQKDRIKDAKSEHEKISKFDHIVIRNKIKHSIHFNSLKAVVNSLEVDDRLTQTIITFLDSLDESDALKKQLMNDQILKAYYACHIIQEGKTDQSKEYVKILKPLLSNVDASDRESFQTTITNFYIGKMNNPESEEIKKQAASDLLLFYKEHLKQGERISPFDYNTIASAASCLPQNEDWFSWAEDFVDKNFKLLKVDAKERPYYHSYCKAVMFFGKKEIEKARALINDIGYFKFKDQIIANNARSLYLKILYETKTTRHLVEAQAKSFVQNFYKGENKHEGKKEVFKKFCKSIEKLTKISMDDLKIESVKKMLNELHKKISEDKTHPSKAWFEEKIKELMIENLPPTSL